MVLVAVLHVIAYWATSFPIRVPRDSKPSYLEWVFISPPPAAEPIRPNPPDITARAHLRTWSPKSPAAPPTSPEASPTDHAPHKPPTDWTSELEWAAKSAAEGDGSDQQRDFGVPRSAPTLKAPTFDWDPVHTHRVEIGPEGGVIVHLSDKCVMVFMPFPFASCGIGKKEANGHLLDHMKDAPSVAEAPAP